MVRWLYNLCFPLVFILLLPSYLRRMVLRGDFRANFGQRLGLYTPELRSRLAAGPPRLWVQAVSVGEMLVALKLIDALRARSPSLPLVLSTTTTTGHRLAAERIGAGIELVYTPVDLRGAARRVFDVLRPTQVVIVDGGLWPNQLWEAKRRGVPTALVNARLSPRSERRFRRFEAWLRRCSGSSIWCACPRTADLARWASLGVSPTRIKLTGSVKFDDFASGGTGPLPGNGILRNNLTQVLQSIGVQDGAPILLAGSTHPGEERIVAEVFRQLRQRFEHLFLVVAPRHVERAPQIRAELAALGWRVASPHDVGRRVLFFATA